MRRIGQSDLFSHLPEHLDGWFGVWYLATFGGGLVGLVRRSRKGEHFFLGDAGEW